MKALVIGYGSIGKRHARVLQGLGLAVAVVSRRQVDAPRVFPAIKQGLAEWAPDYVVIASRTNEHQRDLATLAGAGFNGTVVVEKPLFDRPGDLPGHGFEKAFVAYNLRFHPALRRFKALLDDLKPFAVHAYVGQYLPDWRPGGDYRESYSAKRDEGGGVLRDLSHELDYLNWMLGGWTRLTAAGGHVSDLEIDSDDAFSLLFETGRCPVVSVQMNYLDSSLRREVLALTDRGNLRADLVAGTVAFAGEIEAFDSGDDDTFIAEHEAALAGDASVLCSLDDGLDVMRMIDAAERAAAEKLWVAA